MYNRLFLYLSTERQNDLIGKNIKIKLVWIVLSTSSSTSKTIFSWNYLWRIVAYNSMQDASLVLNQLCSSFFYEKKSTYKIVSLFSLRPFKWLLKTGSDKIIYWLGKFYFLLGFIMSKTQERLRSELWLQDKITNLLCFLT